jgi:uncharacterized protein YjbI with pentapeptide repeats
MSQDFSGQNLQGRSFKGQNLEGANFSYANIQGTDFRNCNLRGANFSHAKAGLNYAWTIFLVISSFVVAVLTGFVSGTSGIVASNALSTEFITKYTIVPSIVIILTILAVFLCTIYYGLTIAIVNLVWVLCAIWIFTWVGDRDKAADWTLALALAFGWSGALAWCGAFSEACAGKLAWIWNLTAVLIWVLAGASRDKSHLGIWSWVAIAIAAWALTSIGSYIARKGFAGEPKFSFVRSIIVVFGAIGGTNFRGADLIDANFTKAILTSTNLGDANITRTCWLNAQKLERARVGDSYLKYPQVRNLVVTGVGENQNFDDLSLQGINLLGANLADTSFVRTNLNQANLQDTNLSRAKLVQTQLDGADLTWATLTGATIEDWGITSHTKLHGVRCEYVFMRLPTKENPNPHRKPDNWKEKFEDGDFADFIKPIVDTLDLYHNQGVDPRAIAIAFKQLAENNPDAELRIVGIEVKGENKFLLRAKTVLEADKSELSAEYFETYNHLKGLPEQEMGLLLAEQQKYSRIRSLETMVQTALQGSKIHEVRTILFLAANPATSSRLRLDEESRQIEIGLQRAKKREQFDLKQKWAVRVRDVSNALLDFKPQIVHFSGHGTGDDGLVLEDETGNVQLVETQALAKLFKLFVSNVECVILNACYSQVQADEIAQHIPYVIGMNKEIGDKVAIEFAVGFYAALGAGESIEFAYEFGCIAIELAGFPEHLTPVLKKKRS